MIQIDWSLGASAAIFLVTLLALNRILFQPLFRVLDSRKAETTDLVEEAARNESYYSELADRYQERIKEGKQAGYKDAEERRAEAMRERLSRLEEARQQAEKVLGREKSRIQSELEDARGRLRQDADEIAALITGQILKGS